jgi:class 3 adenylate cyclase
VLSVLFADLVGFTSRSERLDPEDVQAFLEPYYACLRDQIQAFGGEVEKYVGDAVVGVFGAPTAHGDDPERAVRAALTIRDSLAEMNAADPSLDLQVRIAVNTGEAIVTAKMWAGEAMVTGDSVNTAARLQVAAPNNSVLVGEETYRSTRFVIEYEAVDPIFVKGKQAPVSAWLAISAARPPGERAAERVPLVGRRENSPPRSRVQVDGSSEEGAFPTARAGHMAPSLSRSSKSPTSLIATLPCWL